MSVLYIFPYPRFSKPLQTFKSALFTFLADVLVVFMEIHVRFVHFDTSYPAKAEADSG